MELTDIKLPKKTDKELKFHARTRGTCDCVYLLMSVL